MKKMKTINLLGAILGLFLAGACNRPQASGEEKINMEAKMEIKKEYLEVVRFKLKKEVTIDQFRKAEADIRKGAIQKQGGYLGREIYQDVDGSWLIIIRWLDKSSAEAWTPIFMTLPEGKAFGGLLDFSSARQEHYTLVNP